MPLVHPAFGIGPTFYMSPTTLIKKPDDMLSSPLRQHILDYEPPRGFVILDFSTFDGSTNPYDHMLHYNQAMILNASNDQLLCKVFPASLRGLELYTVHVSYTVQVSYTFISKILSYNLSYTILYFYLHSYTFHIRYFCILSSVFHLFLVFFIFQFYDLLHSMYYYIYHFLSYTYIMSPFM